MSTKATADEQSIKQRNLPDVASHLDDPTP
jgi:hypothetical protein